MIEDYYKILGVKPNASDIEIKSSYKQLAKLHHPDKNIGNKESEELFKLINLAYQTLSDPWKRMSYDFKREHLNNPSPPISPPPQRSTKRDQALSSALKKKAYIFTFGFFLLITTLGLFFYQYMNGLSAERAYRSGLEMQKKNNYNAAFAKFSEAIYFDDQFAKAYLQRGIICAELDSKPNLAIYNFKQAIQLDSTLGEVYFYLAKVYLADHRISLAITEFQNCINCNVFIDSAYFYQAEIRRRITKDFKTAISNYEQAIRYNHQSLESLAGIGYCQYQLKNFKTSIAFYNQAISKKPKNAEWTYQRGLAKLKLKLNNAACRDFVQSGRLGNESAKKIWKKVCE
ncbi:MAG: hypothetical protein EAZ07_10375 [Cytophagales bacterium]|nr:MAG: hypothetical protein EAZ07_10375 [Cytophagales bacterium]